MFYYVGMFRLWLLFGHLKEGYILPFCVMKGGPFINQFIQKHYALARKTIQLKNLISSLCSNEKFRVLKK